MAAKAATTAPSLDRPKYSIPLIQSVPFWFIVIYRGGLCSGGLRSVATANLAITHT